VPEECHFHVFLPDELYQVPAPLWIVFAGTSVQRGTFLSAVDILLRDRGANLTTFRVSSCWGWMDLTIDRFRVSYIDFRFSVLFPMGTKPPSFMEPLLTTHAIQALRAIGSSPGGGPDLFYLEMGNWAGTVYEPHIIRSWLGEEWSGRFLVHFVKPCPSPAYCRDRLDRFGQPHPPALHEWVDRHPQSGLEVVDEGHMAYAFVDQCEGPIARRSSQHLHRPCANPSEAAGARICSSITDMSFQMLLNVFMSSARRAPGLAAPRAPFLPPRPATAAAANRSLGPGAMRFCQMCPPGLEPFTIFPDALTRASCFDHIPGGKLVSVGAGGGVVSKVCASEATGSTWCG
jgi:hypothetical protein